MDTIFKIWWRLFHLPARDMMVFLGNVKDKWKKSFEEFEKSVLV